MKTRILLSLALLICIGSTRPPASSRIVGDYVEARTASVFAGACHYNGELVTTGRDAVMAWSIASGTYNGTDLSGVKAMAAVSSQANLGDDHAARQSELVIDTAASSAQAAAFTALLHDQCGSQLGQITAIHRAPVSFSDEALSYHVTAENFASLSIQPMPNNECCLQPNLVWYTPLFHIDHRKVGFTTTAAYTAGTVGDAWQQSGENSAFYGSFSVGK
jgi:hypothetical protein